MSSSRSLADILAGLDPGEPEYHPKRAKKKPKPPKAPTPVPSAVEEDEEDEEEQSNSDPKPLPVRSPRLASSHTVRDVIAPHAKKVMESGTLLPTTLGVETHTRERRADVLSWMLNGHTHRGELVELDILADKLGTPLHIVEQDVETIKSKMADYFAEGSGKDASALAHMLIEMRFQDRGRALLLYNTILADIRDADEGVAEIKDPVTGKVRTVGKLSGRERASMYSAALSALDLANKATQGVDALFKMTGAGARVNNYIIARMNILQAQTNGSVKVQNAQQLMDFLSEVPEFRSILPSARKKLGLATPASLDLEAEDRDILEIGEKARAGEFTQGSSRRKHEVADLGGEDL